jgi:biotin synthase-like enzyme
MTDELQALCLHADANGIFLGDKLLTTANAGEDHDHNLLRRLDVALARHPIESRQPAATSIEV